MLTEPRYGGRRSQRLETCGVWQCVRGSRGIRTPPYHDCVHRDLDDSLTRHVLGSQWGGPKSRSSLSRSSFWRDSAEQRRRGTLRRHVPPTPCLNSPPEPPNPSLRSKASYRASPRRAAPRRLPRSDLRPAAALRKLRAAPSTSDTGQHPSARRRQPYRLPHSARRRLPARAHAPTMQAIDPQRL
jgi:hypothetical protein